ncbi:MULTISPECIES: MspA family porin [unclassified Brenneria]|uniref:MspA family porin n=1 Tax=unclassified Brenneria TaxID=2634434 RepID=UPI001554C959|nr:MULTISPECIES: MspA family porin [unclassified Brenneria]MBJ7222567.1 MspA family porin [Brenneria sp. L3-3C-1]MEE3643811.1 MspA family porin [Brenneria sp. L3_3C_1]MEE3651236.1 MspA family porin [Brenneria sp. HEZEL_4_2_4]NPD01193.1 follicular epithelium yolk protein subunit [Brenneria sp. hezel4-2-4]
MSIRINVTTSGEQSSISTSAVGVVRNIISDTERNTFQLNDNQLKRAFEITLGRWPNDAFLRSPTPWGDLYDRFNWQQVQRTLRPRNIRVLSQTSRPEIVLTQDFINNSSVAGTFDASISQTVENTVTSTWSTGGALTVGHSVEYGINFLGTGVTGNSSISYTQEWGVGGSRSTSVTLGMQSGVTIPLGPGQAVTAELVATRGTMRIQVEYIASLQGHAAANYNPPHNGHHFWRGVLSRMMSETNISNSVVSTETINIGFYSHSQIILRDKRTKQIVRVVDLDMLGVSDEDVKN